MHAEPPTNLHPNLAASAFPPSRDLSTVARGAKVEALRRTRRSFSGGGRRKIHRILMTADAVGGVWTYALDLARELVSRGVSVDLAVMGPPPSDAQRTDAVRAGLSLIERPGRLEWMDEPWRDVDAAGEWLIDLDRARHPDIIHLNGFCHGALPWSAPAVIVAHSCVRSWWRAVRGEGAPDRFNDYRARVSAGVGAAALVVAPTAAMLAHIESDYGPPGAARVIPNGRTFAPATGVTREPIVLAAGRLWDEAKNMGALCAAARDITWPVCIAGNARHAGSTYAVPSHVRHLGCLDGETLGEWFARASIYALPARYEPFGLSVLEAALSGCALVLGDIRSLRENWNGAALFVPPDNRPAIAAGIQALIDDERVREALAARARARAARFTVDRMADAYLAAYSFISARRGPTPGSHPSALGGAALRRSLQAKVVPPKREGAKADAPRAGRRRSRVPA